MNGRVTHSTEEETLAALSTTELEVTEAPSTLVVVVAVVETTATLVVVAVVAVVVTSL